MTARIPESANAWALSGSRIGVGALVMVRDERVVEVSGATSIAVGMAMSTATRAGVRVWLHLTELFAGLPKMNPPVVKAWRKRGLRR